VVLRHRAPTAACACLTVDATKAAAYTPCQRAQPRLGQQMFFCTTIAKIHGVLLNVFSMVFYKGVLNLQINWKSGRKDNGRNLQVVELGSKSNGLKFPINLTVNHVFMQNVQ